MNYKILFRLFIFWILVCYLPYMFNTTVDAYNEIGIPFTFYRSFFGKCIDCKPLGFLWGGFIGDVLLLFLVSFTLKPLISKAKTKD